MTTGLLGFTSIEERGGDVRDYVSPSRLNCWLGCGLRFKCRYIDGLPSPTTPALFLGRQIHRGLESFYRHRQLGITLSADEVVQRMLAGWAAAVDEDGMVFESVETEQAMHRQAADLIGAYLKHAPANEKPLAVEVAVEAPLIDPDTGEDLGLPLVGVIDLVLGEPEGAVISDFKTSSKSSPPDEITHEVQLSSYSWLFRHAQGRDEAGLEIRSLIKTKTPKVEFHRYPRRSDAHFGRLFAIVRAYLDDLDAGRFVIRPGWGCASCEFKEGPCRAWCG